MKNVHIRVTEGKIENLKKEVKMTVSTLIFIYTIHFAYLKCTQSFIILNQIVAEKFLMKNIHICYIGVREIN